MNAICIHETSKKAKSTPAEQLSKGEVSLMDLLVPSSTLTNGEVAYLNVKFPHRSTGPMSIASSWEEINIPFASAPIRLQVERIQIRDGNLASIMFIQVDESDNETVQNMGVIP
jgi:hypothetical protein